MFPEEVKNKTVFVAPLDWGLGHATRCIPIIKTLLDNSNRVVLGVTKSTERVLLEEFPKLEKVYLPEYAIRYSALLPLWLKLLLQYPAIKRVVSNEHKLLNEIINTHKIDFVISDNRYGLYHSKIKSVIICHQLNLKTPFFTSFANRVHNKLLKKFSEIWVPDFEDKTIRLAGELSNNISNLNAVYIGPQSRLTKSVQASKYDYLFLLSGPEPLQGNFLDAVLKFSPELNGKKIAIVSGSRKNVQTNSNDNYFYLPDAKALSELVCCSDTIICRSGYSTLMDLNKLDKKELVLVPTKGQTEQEYLASYWKSKFGARVALSEKKLFNLLKSKKA
ncbi:MAG: glycosyltransferase [Bacteroidia bacterium]|nr:glycosyltransferase [Bacteroidia bacterium]